MILGRMALARSWDSYSKKALSMTDLSGDEARRIALAAQGFAEPKPSGRIDIRHLRRVMSRVELLQIDTVNVLVRAHYMPLFARLGSYPMSLLDEAVYERRELFETWAHAASLARVERYPLLRRRMEGDRRYRWMRRWADQNARYVHAILDEVRRRGPITAAELEDPGRRGGECWVRTQGKVALAFGPAHLLDEVVQKKLARCTQYTNINPKSLEAEVAAVARNGWAVAPEEALMGVNALAAPIFDAASELAGTITIVGSIQHLPAQPDSAVIAAVRSAAAEISARLGYREAAAG